MLLVLVLVLDFDLFKKKDVEFNCNSYVIRAVSVVLVLFSVYFGMVNALYLFGEHKAVDKIYGHDTMSKMYLITEEKNSAALLKYADEIQTILKEVDRPKIVKYIYDLLVSKNTSRGMILLLMLCAPKEFYSALILYKSLI